MTDKSILRDEARRHRAQIHVKAEHFDQASRHFFDTFNPSQGTVISGYWPTGAEFDSLPLLEEAHARGCICALPSVDKDSRVLKFVRWHPGCELVSGVMNIPEPKRKMEEPFLEPEIVLVPLLAYDRRGYRLGQGGGYYDATLEHLRAKKKILAIGLAFSEQAVLFKLPIEDHDQQLDGVVTPTGAQFFM